MALDRRLSLIMKRCSGRVADIGCDHGKLSCALAKSGTEKVIAADISAKCLKKAEELAVSAGVDEVMECRLGDGLNPICSGEVDTVVIAGMGGDVIEGILDAAEKDGKKFFAYVLSPNTHAEKARAKITLMGYTVVNDEMVECGGKYYPVIRAEATGGEKLDEIQLEFGKFCCADEVFKEYAAQEIAKINEIENAGGGSEKLYARRLKLATAADLAPAHAK